MTSEHDLLQTKASIKALCDRTTSTLTKLETELDEAFGKFWDDLGLAKDDVLVINDPERVCLTHDGDYVFDKLTRQQIHAVNDWGGCEFEYSYNVYDTLHALSILQNNSYTLETDE